MAKRPVFIVSNKPPFYKEEIIEFKFYNGFSEKQKKKSVSSLHEAFLKEQPNNNILEVSSKSDIELGIKLSAFNLMMENTNNKKYSVETVFQSSKVFENGGPYTDILKMTSRDAKKDIRLKESGKLKCFNCFGRVFPLKPINYFYNWLYINTLNLNNELGNEVMKYDSFTDIEFNPEKSLNCQATAVAVYVSLRKQGLLEKALKDKDSFLEVVYGQKNESNNTEKHYKQINILDEL